MLEVSAKGQDVRDGAGFGVFAAVETGKLEEKGGDGD